MSMRGVTLSVSSAVFMRLIEQGRKCGLTPNLYAQKLFEDGYAADCLAPKSKPENTPEGRSGTAREAPSTVAEQPAAEPVVEAAAAVEIQSAAPPEAAGPPEPAAPFPIGQMILDEARAAGIVTPAANFTHYADLLLPRQIKTVRGYRSAGMPFSEIATLTGHSAELCKAACRGMR